MYRASSFYQLTQAWQSLRRHPMFSINIVLTLTITLGALVCAATLMYLMLVKPLPYPNLDKLYVAKQSMTNQDGEFIGEGFSYPAAKHLHKYAQAIEKSALSYYVSDVITSLSTQPTAETGYVTHEWFSLLGAEFELGNNFSADNGLESFVPGAILSYQLWQEQFSGDKEVLSKSVQIRGVSHPIIGVLSPSFIEPEVYGVGHSTQLWLAWDFNWSEQMGWGNLSSIDGAVHVLLQKPDSSSLANIQNTLQRQQRELWQQTYSTHPSFQYWQVSTELIDLTNAIYQGQAQLIYYIFFGCLGIFIIAMANISNLFMSRTVEQQRNLAIHAAIGANRWKIFTILFTEYGLLLFFALPFVLLFSYLGFFVLQHYLQDVLPRVSELALSGVSIAFSVVTLVILNIVFTTICRQIVPYRHLNYALNQSGKGSGLQIKASIRTSLISIQIAAAASLIFINLSLFNQAYHTIKQPMGIDVDQLSQLRLMAKTPTETSQDVLRTELVQVTEALTQQPEISSATISLSPLIWFGNFPLFDVVQNKQYSPQVKMVDHGYFPILNQEIVAGENFKEHQIMDKERVMIINEEMAKLLAPEGTALNRRVVFWGQEFQIIGIVKGLNRPGDIGIPPRAYVPDKRSRANIMLKSSISSPITKAMLLKTVESVSSNYTIREVTPLIEDKHRLLFMQYTTLAITGTLTILTLFLAIIGLYGVLNYSSQLRKFEIGTRLAIGAKGRDILSMMFKDNLSALIIGLTASFAITSLLFMTYSQYLAALLNASSPVWLAATLTSVLATTLLGCYLPIRPLISRPVIHSLRNAE